MKRFMVIALMLWGGLCYAQHISHIKTFGFAPEGKDMTWEADHYDLIVDSASLPQYKQLNPDMLGVGGQVTLYIGTVSSDYQELRGRYENAGRDDEDAFLHFGTNTKLWLSSRNLYIDVPGWDTINDTNSDGIWDTNNNPNATATTRDKARVPYDSKEALWQVIARVIDQGSRLSAVRLAKTHAACDILDIERGFDENDLYENLAWL